MNYYFRNVRSLCFLRTYIVHFYIICKYFVNIFKLIIPVLRLVIMIYFLCCMHGLGQSSQIQLEFPSFSDIKVVIRKVSLISPICLFFSVKKDIIILARTEPGKISDFSKALLNCHLSIAKRNLILTDYSQI